MTMWDFFHQATFWQWFGLIFLAGTLCSCFPIIVIGRRDKDA